MLILAIAMVSSHAQMGGFGGGHGRRSGQQQQNSSTAAPQPSLPLNMQQVWPRLDPGAIFCGTQDGLVRYQTMLSGDEASSSSAALNCRRITQPTGIKILDRVGIAQTQVQLLDQSNQVGWTNNYLPTTQPN
jgi:hypothetical protein